METTTTTNTEQLQQLSRLIDVFCNSDFNFDADGTWSKTGTRALFELMEQYSAELGTKWIRDYWAPRAHLLRKMPDDYTPGEAGDLERAERRAGKKLWVIQNVFEKLKKGAPPHLSPLEACLLLSLWLHRYHGHDASDA